MSRRGLLFRAVDSIQASEGARLTEELSEEERPSLSRVCL